MKSIRIAAAAAAALICGSAVAAGSLSESAKAGGDVWIQNDKSGYSVEYVGDNKSVGLQFDIHDKAITEGTYSCGEQLAESHIASCTLHADEGFLRVVVFSLSNEILSDSTLVRISKASSDGAKLSKSYSATGAKLSNVLFTDAQGQNVTPDHF